MSTLANRSGGHGRPTPPVPAPAPVPLLPRRRRWGLLALGVVLVALCAVIAYLLVVTAGVTRPYLALAHDVAYGATFGPDDLTTVSVNPAAGLAPIPAADRGTVIGKQAAADLFAGTLLTRAQVTAKAVPGPGQQLVGMELKPGQVPARALRPGDAVTLVVVAAADVTGVSSDSSSGADAAPSTIPATVAETARSQTAGNVRVDVAVSQAEGPTVAALAAAARIVIIVTARK